MSCVCLVFLNIYLYLFLHGSFIYEGQKMWWSCSHTWGASKKGRCLKWGLCQRDQSWYLNDMKGTIFKYYIRNMKYQISKWCLCHLRQDTGVSVCYKNLSTSMGSEIRNTRDKNHPISGSLSLGDCSCKDDQGAVVLIQPGHCNTCRRAALPPAV